MTDHAGCRFVRWESGKAACGSCGEHLADRGRNGLVLRDILVPRPKRHGDLRTYGLRDAARLRGKSATRTSAKHPTREIVLGTIQGELYVYCPNLACGRGMHLGLPSP